jgi:hypothetical protein
LAARRSSACRVAQLSSSTSEITSVIVSNPRAGMGTAKCLLGNRLR